MNTTEHTPGPWVVLEPPNGLPEVWQFGKAECVTDRVFNGNAKLIAAAPQLLTALTELELRTRQFIEGELIQFPAALLPQVQDIIKAAKGSE